MIFSEKCVYFLPARFNITFNWSHTKVKLKNLCTQKITDLKNDVNCLIFLFN